MYEKKLERKEGGNFMLERSLFTPFVDSFFCAVDFMEQNIWN